MSPVDVKSIQSEEPFQAPPRPPKHRVWRGAMVAPFGANTALVLHKCSLDSGTGEEFLVQALHNEKSVSMPVCVPPSFFCHCTCCITIELNFIRCLRRDNTIELKPCLSDMETLSWKGAWR